MSRDEVQARFPDAQLPAHLVVPDYVATRGPAVADLCTAVGFAPDPQQAMFLDLIFAVSDVVTEQPAVTVLDLVAPRRNLKSSTFIMCCLGWLYLPEVRVRRVLWSAHEEKASKEAQRDMKRLIEESDLIKLQPDTRNQGFFSANDAVAIVTARRDGFESRVDFGTRTKDGGRGGRADKLIIDEMYAVQPAHMEALSPVVATASHAQQLFASSAARPESDVMRGRVTIGRAGQGSPSSVYAEYCAPPAEVACNAGERCRHEYHEAGCAMGKPEMLAAANTSYGDRIPAAHFDAQWQNIGPGAVREWLGWHDTAGAVELRPLRVDQWRDVRDEQSQRAKGAVFALGVDVSPRGDFVSFGIAAKRPDDLTHLEAFDLEAMGELAGSSESRVVDAICALANAPTHKPIVTVLDNASPAGVLVPELLTRGFVRVSKVDDAVPRGSHRLLLLGAQDNARACMGLVADVRELKVRHTGQASLDAAVAGATGRALVGGTAWSRKDTSVNITPLQAVTNARHGLVVFGAAKVKREVWGALI